MCGVAASRVAGERVSIGRTEDSEVQSGARTTSPGCAAGLFGHFAIATVVVVVALVIVRDNANLTGGTIVIGKTFFGFVLGFIIIGSTANDQWDDQH